MVFEVWIAGRLGDKRNANLCQVQFCLDNHIKTLQTNMILKMFLQPLMLIVPDVQDVYTPLETDVVVPVSEVSFQDSFSFLVFFFLCYLDLELLADTPVSTQHSHTGEICVRFGGRLPDMLEKQKTTMTEGKGGRKKKTCKKNTTLHVRLLADFK